MSTTSNGQETKQVKDCCEKVRTSCKEWLDQHKEYVTIQSVDKLAEEIWEKSHDKPIEWDEEAWHYIPSKEMDPKIRLERLALYILALDAINFCFWPTHNNQGLENFEYEHLAIAMANMARQDEVISTTEYVFAPARLSEMTNEQMQDLWMQHGFSDKSALYNLSKRAQLWREVGNVLMTQFDGSILKLLGVDNDNETWPNHDENHTKSHRTAPELVDLLVQHFTGFQDHVLLDNENDEASLHLYKRAQICVADWNAALKLQLEGMDQLTTFADYRVPQLLRHVGVLEYSPTLAQQIDTYQELSPSSPEENSIRAATVVAVETLVHHLKSKQQSLQKTQLQNKPQPSFTAVTVDWYLWQVGEKLHMEGKLEPHHRVRTIFY